MKSLFKKLPALALCAAIAAGAASCAASKDASATQGQEVRYNEAVNYAVRNDAPEQTARVVYDMETFDSIFTPTATMGEEGRPSLIDFGFEVVVPVILPVTDRATELEIKSVTSETRKDGQKFLIVAYKAKRGKKNSYKIHPAKILLVSREYIGSKVLLIEK